MQRFKSFSSQSCGDDVARFERIVNDWLESAKPRIQHMAQSAFGSHLSELCLRGRARPRGGRRA